MTKVAELIEQVIDEDLARQVNQFLNLLGSDAYDILSRGARTVELRFIHKEDADDAVDILNDKLAHRKDILGPTRSGQRWLVTVEG